MEGVCEGVLGGCVCVGEYGWCDSEGSEGEGDGMCMRVMV